MTRALFAASFFTASFEPAAMIFPDAMATASATESFASTVRILPLIRMRSAVWARETKAPPENIRRAAEEINLCIWCLIVPRYLDQSQRSSDTSYDKHVGVNDRMRIEWNRRAKRDAHIYVTFRRQHQNGP